MKRSLGAKTLIFASTWIVGSYDQEGKPNGMTAAWGGMCCSDPPCVAVSLRKATYSYGSLVERKAFTVFSPGNRVYCGVGASLGHAFAVGKEI